ncbi:hypothetical protein AAULH_14316, partial [Lactobacillus helveticus MTCC 5463]
ALEGAGGGMGPVDGTSGGGGGGGARGDSGAATGGGGGEGHEAKSGLPSVEWGVVPELETLPLVEAAALEQLPPAGNPLAWAVNPSQLPNLTVQEPVGHAYPVDVIVPSGLNLLAH